MGVMALLRNGNSAWPHHRLPHSRLPLLAAAGQVPGRHGAADPGNIEGQILRESLILLQYLEDVFPGLVVAQSDPYRRAVEGPMARLEADVGLQGYRFVFESDWHLRPWPSKQKYGPSASDAELGL
jgi:glutathione S-transferase